MNSTPNILYVDNNPHEMDIIIESLRKEKKKFNIIKVTSDKNLIKLLKNDEFELIISEINIFDFKELQILDFFKSKIPEIPVIIFTGDGSEKIAVEAIKKGAADYVSKNSNNVKELLMAVKELLKQKNEKASSTQNENKRIESYKEYYNIVENNPEAIIITCEGIIVYINFSALKMLGLKKPNEIINKKFLDFIHYDDNKTTIESNIKGQKGKVNIEIIEEKLLRSDGSLIDVELRSYPIIYKDKNSNQVILRDITQNENFDKIQGNKKTDQFSFSQKLTYVLDAINELSKI